RARDGDRRGHRRPAGPRRPRLRRPAEGRLARAGPRRQRRGRRTHERRRAAAVRRLAAFLLRDLRGWSSYRFAMGLQLVGLLFQLTVFFFIGEAVEIKDRSAILRYTASYYDFVVIGLAV